MTNDGVNEVHIYPYGHADFAIPYRHTKVLHFLRHAEGVHNVNRQYRDIQNLDARLTEKGKEQCRKLDESIRNHSMMMLMRGKPLSDLASSVDLIVTSPLTRCVETTLGSFQSILKLRQPPPPVIAHEFIRETVNYNCDRRRTISEIQREWDATTIQIDWSHIPDDPDFIWNKYEQQLGCHETWTRHRESAEIHVVAERGRQFFQWLRQRPETHVAVCTHSAFLRCILNFGLSEQVPMQPPQILDRREHPIVNPPVVRYFGSDNQPIDQVPWRDYENCELRSMIVAFPFK
jgi:broad specificity phosphatase PhoE